MPDPEITGELNIHRNATSGEAIRLHAVSAATEAFAWVRSGPPSCVLHVFDSVCNLIDEGGRLLSLILDPGQMDPFTILLEPPSTGRGFCKWIDAESSVTILPGEIWVGNLQVVVGTPVLWNSRPDWGRIRNVLNHATGWISLTEARLVQSRSTDSIAMLINTSGASPPGPGTPWWETAAPYVRAIQDGLADRDEHALGWGASRLAGLGPGLTPSGDDFLVGLMYAVRTVLGSGEADSLCRTIEESAVPRTGVFSAAHIKAAARGEAASNWHALFSAGIKGEHQEIHAALERLLALGHTSGEDALSGYVLGLKSILQS